MRKKNENFLQDITDGETGYTYSNGLILLNGKVIQPETLHKHFSTLIMRPTVNAIKEIIETIKLCCAEDDDVDLWGLWKNDMNKLVRRFKDKLTTPLIATLYDKQTQFNVDLIISSLLQGKQKYMFVLHGVSGAGKSILIDHMIEVFNDYQTVKQMTDFNGQFTLDGIQNKLLVQCNDLGKEQVTDRASGRFKQICDGSKVNIERKGKQEEIVKPWFNMLFGCNIIPQFNVLDAGNMTRGAYVYFNNKLKLPMEYNKLKDDLAWDLEIANTYNYYTNKKVDTKSLEALNYKWQQAQLDKYKRLISPKTNFQGFLDGCSSNNMRVNIDKFEFEEIKDMLYGKGTMYDVTHNEIEEGDLPF